MMETIHEALIVEERGSFVPGCKCGWVSPYPRATYGVALSAYLSSHSDHIAVKDHYASA